ncbi:MAG: FkbM family methyltransferase [Terriglobia bacterium]
MLFKLNVQGHELEALKACEDLLDRFAYVYVECSFMELYKGQALADEVIARNPIMSPCVAAPGVAHVNPPRRGF